MLFFKPQMIATGLHGQVKGNHIFEGSLYKLYILVLGLSLNNEVLMVLLVGNVSVAKIQVP